ncbi:MAG: hypothetical protein LJE85_09930 [Gammaproteobacteria bacterium]|nr:hypothetical protein [Gammaproteobacteria bacterium]
MHSARTRSSIGLGFFAIAALFFAIVAIWLSTVSNTNTYLQQLNQGESQRQLVFAMRDAAHQRNLALFRMVALQDVFARDSEYLRFKESAGHFIAARQQLLEHYLTEDTVEHWHRLKPLIQHSETLQNAIVELIMEDNNAAALAVIEQEFIPTQRDVSQQLTNMLGSAREDIVAKLNSARDATQTHYHIILLLILLATSIGYLIAKTVLRRNDEAHNVLLRKNRQISAINTAISKPHTSLEEQVNIILRLGCELLSMDGGLLLEAHLNTPATVLDRYPKDLPPPIVNNQKLLNYLVKPSEKSAILVFDSTSSDCNSDLLSQALQESENTSLIATPLNTSKSTHHVVVFTRSKNVPLNTESTELLQLLGNKLAVLLDQQETLERLQDAKLAAETANKTKTAFLANITHELRTPLHRIIHHIESLYEKLAEQQQPECIADVNKIQESSQQLCALISNLLDVTQLESGNMVMNHQQLDIEALLRDTQNDLNPQVTQSNLQFDTYILNELGNMHCDADRIRQVIHNLLSFCGKLPQPSKISLTAWREPSPEGDWLYLEVKDTANGISKKQLNQLFKLNFTDSPEGDKKSIHQEIRLAITKKVCELLGGDILAESHPHQSTIFTICLPCHAQPHSGVVSATA